MSITTQYITILARYLNKVNSWTRKIKKKSTKKATLNLGRDRGSAGLEDYIYDDAGDGDDFEFM